MPVYEQTYSHYEGDYRPRSLVWTVIARRGILQIWRKKWFRMLLLFCLAPFFLMTIRIYLASNLALLEYLNFNLQNVNDILHIDDTFYYKFLLLQSFFCFLMTIITGSDLIALDRRTKALTLYLSKPLSRLDYLFGKASIALFFLYLVTLIPCLLLMFFYAYFNDYWGYLWENRLLIGRIVLFSHVNVIPMIALVLAISSLTKSRVSAVVMFCVVIFVPVTLVNILQELIDPAWMNPEIFTLFSLSTITQQLGPVIFKEPVPYDIHWIWYTFTLLMIIVLCGIILNRQIRAVDIVK